MRKELTYIFFMARLAAFFYLNFMLETKSIYNIKYFNLKSISFWKTIFEHAAAAPHIPSSSKTVLQEPTTIKNGIFHKYNHKNNKYNSSSLRLNNVLAGQLTRARLSSPSFSALMCWNVYIRVWGVILWLNAQIYYRRVSN